MSLKAFHVLFVTLSALLAFGFAGWAARAYSAGMGGTYRGLSVASAVVGVALVVYGIWFRRKITTQDEERRRRRKMIRGAVVAALMFGLADGSQAWACSACFGRAEGPLIDAARLGVWLLFGLVLAVQLAFALFFFRLWRRSRRLADSELRLDGTGFPHGRSLHP